MSDSEQLGETIGAVGLREWRIVPAAIGSNPVMVEESLRDGVMAEDGDVIDGPVARLNVGHEYADLTVDEVRWLNAATARWLQLHAAYAGPRDASELYAVGDMIGNISDFLALPTGTVVRDKKGRSSALADDRSPAGDARYASTIGESSPYLMWSEHLPVRILDLP